MYSDFLEEAATITTNQALADLTANTISGACHEPNGRKICR
jgi:hypothetical protein